MPARGFTLLEMMLVIVLLGLAANSIIGTLPTREENSAQTEAQRFYSLVQLAHEENILGGQTLGLRINPQQYQFLVLAQGKWLPLDNPRYLSSVTLPQNLHVTLQFDGFLWHDETELEMLNTELTMQQESLTMQQKASVLLPQIWFVAGQASVPFTVTITNRKTRESWTVSRQENGQQKITSLTGGLL